MLKNLARLSSIATRQSPDTSDIEDACRLIREAVGAEDCYVLRGGDPHYIQLGSDANPLEYEVKQKGYWIMWRELASRPEASGGLFTVEDRLVMGGEFARAGVAATHYLAILAGQESNSELLVVRGPWPEGIPEDVVSFLIAARPTVAYLLNNVLDADRHARQRDQLASIAEIARAFSEAHEVENAASAVATGVAKASGIDWVMVCLTNDDCTEVREVTSNQARYSNSDAAQNPLPIGAEPVLAMGRHILETGRPILWPDVFAQNIDPGLASYWQRAHVLSTAVFPLIWNDRLLGLVFMSSTTARRFDEEEVSFLQGLISQASTTIAGLQLYRELEESSRVQHFLARTDALTGIPNRRYIEEVLRAEAARAQRTLEPLSLVMADLDQFKRINDRLGHQAGDLALRHVADFARQSCREADFVGRWGGDEFLFILPSTDIGGAASVAERFRMVLSDANLTGERFRKSLRVSVSAGIAQTRDDLTSSSMLIDEADRALYRAKELGRNRVVLASAAAVAA